ncbi:hypothetical protein CVT26_007798 [Gymnopilus dilepis]|uniref:Uncharacterized protein n=1 Tax=Gymnopilus dilepis TaxID=231916 RepID=A0A409YJY6_9AGAR|nr:hypothetical protein CVT26_007798 [Gymnopilus dilepis]
MAELGQRLLLIPDRLDCRLGASAFTICVVQGGSFGNLGNLCARRSSDWHIVVVLGDPSPWTCPVSSRLNSGVVGLMLTSFAFAVSPDLRPRLHFNLALKWRSLQP